MSGGCPRVVSRTEGVGTWDIGTDAVGRTDHTVMLPPTFREIRVQHRLGSEGVMYITVDH